MAGITNCSRSTFRARYRKFTLEWYRERAEPRITVHRHNLAAEFVFVAAGYRAYKHLRQLTIGLLLRSAPKRREVP